MSNFSQHLYLNYVGDIHHPWSSASSDSKLHPFHRCSLCPASCTGQRAVDQSLKSPWLRALGAESNMDSSFLGGGSYPSGEEAIWRLFSRFVRAFPLAFPSRSPSVFVWGKNCVRLIWLAAQLSSLHISLQTNPTRPRLSWLVAEVSKVKIHHQQNFVS